MGKRYASGKYGLGECGKSGIQTELKYLVKDGYFKGLLVLPEYYEPPDPQTKRANAADAIVLRNPSPRRDEIGITIRFPTMSAQYLTVNPPLSMTATLNSPTIIAVGNPANAELVTEDGLSSYVTEDGLSTYVLD